jgi:outer membrane protein, multidrug efflux system
MFDRLRMRLPAGEADGFRGRWTLLTGLCCLPMLAGCITTVERPDLAVDIPRAYQATSGAPGGSKPSLDWWRTFGSAELTRLIEQAQSENFDIAIAVARIVQADAQSKVAGAPLLPAVNFNSSAVQSKSAGGPERGSITVALNASYEIDFWGKNRAVSRAAQESAIVSRFNRDVVVLSTIGSVATAYFQVLQSQERLRTARDNLAAANRVLTLINQRFTAGTASQLDVAQQESLVASVRAVIPVLDQALRQNIAVLAVLVGRAPANQKVRGGKLYELAIPRVAPGLPSEILFQRPDIRAAEAALASSEASVEAARAAFFPSISLTGQGGLTSSALKTLFTPESAFWQLATNLAQPVFDGFRLEGLLEQAEGRRAEFFQTYRKSIVSAFGDVELALIAVADNAERERLQREVVTSSRRAFEIAEQRLREGTVDLVTVLQTQQTLFQAEDTLAQVRFARLQAVLSLFQALGGSWLPPTEATAITTQ